MRQARRNDDVQPKYMREWLARRPRLGGEDIRASLTENIGQLKRPRIAARETGALADISCPPALSTRGDGELGSGRGVVGDRLAVRKRTLNGAELTAGASLSAREAVVGRMRQS